MDEEKAILAALADGPECGCGLPDSQLNSLPLPSYHAMTVFDWGSQTFMDMFLISKLHTHHHLEINTHPTILTEGAFLMAHKILKVLPPRLLQS